jgi:hypothetical protein
MKETACDLESQSIDSETAINIVDAQIKNAKSVLFVNNYVKLEMTSLPYFMK